MPARYSVETALAAAERRRLAPLANLKPCAHCGRPTTGHWCSNACMLAEDGPREAGDE